MTEGGGFVYGIGYKLLYVLVQVVDPNFIGIKACWFGFHHWYVPRTTNEWNKMQKDKLFC